MELSRTIATVAVVLAILLAAGYAVGEDSAAPAPKQAAQKKIDPRETQRQAALEERRSAHKAILNTPK